MTLKEGRAVIKFGGSDLSTGERIMEAARKVIEAGYKETVVVVSAMGKTTNSLIQAVEKMKISPQDYAEVVSMGERTSARVFCSALRALGAESAYFDPSQENWPIITDSSFVDAKPDMPKTQERVRKNIEPLLGKCIPVVCGFLGRDETGKITTFARGGSDITALLLGNCLNASEVVLVKDTTGVLSADPEMVPDAKTFETLGISEMFALSNGGAKVIRHEALRYKLPGQKLRIASFSSKSIAEGGTEIKGHFSHDSLLVSRNDGMSAITAIGDINPKNVSELFSAISEGAIRGISTGEKSITVFANLPDLKGAVNKIHSLGCFKAVCSKEKIGMIGITHPRFVDSPGWVAKIADALALKGINILEVTTSKATIDVFVEESKLKDTFETVSKAGEIFEA
ncbi:MAG: hypothetical protein PHH26_04915 [Candidatus Thermoplasmatota archaeon]|nr:hypothetical protein [Candidatus Thermoplasmatota archaeon]